MTEDDKIAWINYAATVAVIGLSLAGYCTGSVALALAAYLFVPFAVMP